MRKLIILLLFVNIASAQYNLFARQNFAHKPANNFLLSIAPTDGAAYSLRKLGSSLLCVKVRRSSDNALQDIGFTGNSIDIVALTAFVGAGDGFVHTWYDQSPQLVHMIQTTNSKQPKIVSSGVLVTLNSKPSILFIKANATYLTASTSVFGGGYLDIYFVSKLLVADSSGWMNFAAGSFYWQNIGNTVCYIQAKAYSGGGVPQGEFHLFNPYANSGAVYLGVDGTLLGTTTVSVAAVPTGTINNTINAYGASTGWSFDGYMSEMIIYKSTQSLKATINSNIKSFYGL